MPLYKITDSELRQYCKEYIESLEMWLRRLIDDILTTEYGENYYDHTLKDGTNLISKKIKKEINDRITAEPSRYARPIDACLLESEIKIITNPTLYNKHFRKVFDEFFIKGNSEMIRLYLNRLVLPRNKLYHANAISVRDGERVVCYTNDIIESIKKYYSKINMDQEFNVPLILKYKDSFGNTIFRNKFTGKTVVGGNYISFINKEEYFLRPGDKISIEVEIDPTFPNESYSLKWSPTVEESENKFSYIIKNKDVGEEFNISVSLTTTNDWHRLRGADDILVVKFKVLPPPPLGDVCNFVDSEK
ncbi:hypothetical protein [Carboxylicivirga marina]|uniref:Uncharacterized protein n=1 Tax=Carboxylicivirga marina TaxID=2800988 RepID=A0ABS1HJC7_9BACT|nr:hypothetical protein [Carboxylicivirga marina]MBK3517294.1 hypothetical protein [Carboxylicivirga marina]